MIFSDCLRGLPEKTICDFHRERCLLGYDTIELLAKLSSPPPASRPAAHLVKLQNCLTEARLDEFDKALSNCKRLTNLDYKSPVPQAALDAKVSAALLAYKSGKSEREHLPQFFRDHFLNDGKLRYSVQSIDRDTQFQIRCGACNTLLTCPWRGAGQTFPSLTAITKHCTVYCDARGRVAGAAPATPAAAHAGAPAAAHAGTPAPAHAGAPALPAAGAPTIPSVPAGALAAPAAGSGPLGRHFTSSKRRYALWFFYCVCIWLSSYSRPNQE